MSDGSLNQGAGMHDRLIDRLATGLPPVRRLRPPTWRAAGWLAVVLLLGLAVAAHADLSAMMRRMQGAPDMWLAMLGSALTAAAAVVAAFQTSLPDRSPRWALLPLPGLALWLGASGMGCLRDWLVAGTHAASLAESRECLVFILGFSLPLSALLVWMLRRACPLRPNLTAGLGGLAAAAAAATLLGMVHPYDAAVSDLLVHAFAVLLVILANRMFGGRLLSPGRR
jgi:hypothetical protein